MNKDICPDCGIDRNAPANDPSEVCYDRPGLLPRVRKTLVLQLEKATKRNDRVAMATLTARLRRA